MIEKLHKRALRLQNITDPKKIGVFEELNSLEDKVETIEGDLTSKLNQKFEEPVLIELKGLEQIFIQGKSGEKGEPGEDGKTPDKKEIIDEVVMKVLPLIRVPQDGKDGVDGRDGKDGRDGVDGVDGKNGLDGSVGPRGERGEKGQDGKDGKDGQSSPAIFGGKKLTGSTFSFAGDAVTTSFTLPKEPAGKGMFIFAHYQGQWLQKDVHFTLSGKTFNTAGGTLPFTAEASTTIEGFLINF